MLTKKLAKNVSPDVAKRGRSYYYDGHVEVLSIDYEGTVIAEVEGNDTYTVRLMLIRKATRATIKASCTCPYIETHGDFCKHIWATLMAVEKREPYASLPRSASMQLLYANSGVDFGHADPAEPENVDSGGKRQPAIRLAPSSISQRLTELGIPVPPEIAPILDQTVLPAKPKPLQLVPSEKSPKPPPPPPPAWSRFLSDLAARSARYMPSSASVEKPLPVLLYIIEARPVQSGHGQVVVSLATQQMTARGQLGQPKPLSISAADIPRMTDPLDREICLMLVGAGPSTQHHYTYYVDESRFQSWSVSKHVWGVLLPLLFKSGRLNFRRSGATDLVPLTWDDGEPWELCLKLEPKGARDAFELVAKLRRGGEIRKLEEVNCLLEGDPAVWISNGRMGRAVINDGISILEGLGRVGPLTVRGGERTRFLVEIAKLASIPPIIWPESWNIGEITGITPKPELHLTAPENASAGRRYSAVAIRFVYDDMPVSHHAPGAVVIDPVAGRQLRRDRARESDYLRQAAKLGVENESYSTGLRVLESRVPSLLTSLLDDGWTVFGNKTLFRRGGDCTVNVSTGIDWFDLDGHMDFDGIPVPLPELLAAARKGEKFVRLGDGSMGMLPEEWLARHGNLLELGRIEDGKVRFTKTQISLIDALLAELPEATFDRQLAAARERIQTFQGVEAREAPRDFVGTLRPYQQQGLGWLAFLHDFEWGGCLADDMGLGKTVQVLALLADRKRSGDVGASLVVVPKSIVFNWVREAGQFAPQLNVLDYTGTERKGVRENLDRFDVVLTTYGTLKRDIELLKENQFNYVILDEAQAIKNPTSQNAKAVRLLRARRRLVMTGTPVENQLGDLWSLFEFLNPGMLGTVNAFKGAFLPRKTAEQDGGQLRLLHRTLRPFILRRTKAQVAPDLPQRTEQTVECAMPAKQAAYYNELRDHYRAKLLGRIDKDGIAKSKIYVLEALLRLRQAACHPGLVDESKRNVDSAKLEALLPMIEELTAEGHKALVFSQFTSMLAIVRTELDSRKLTYEYLDGQTTDRNKRVDRFQADAKCPLFLISLKAGGVGLNLTAADYVFILDPWWNPAVEAQAIDRTHRIGQDKNVIAYRLIARDTVEAKIIELQQSKRKLAEEIITESNSLVQSLTRDDLALLLS